MTIYHEQSPDELTPHVPSTMGEELSEHKVNSRVQEIASWSKYQLPTLEQLKQGPAALEHYASGITSIPEGIDKSSLGYDVSKHQLQQALHNIDPKRWILQDGQIDRALRVTDEAVQGAEDLEQQDRKDFLGFMRRFSKDTGIDPDPEDILPLYKDNWSRRLALSEAVFDELEGQTAPTPEEPEATPAAAPEVLSPKSVTKAVQKAAKKDKGGTPTSQTESGEKAGGDKPGKELVGPVEVVEGEIIEDDTTAEHVEDAVQVVGDTPPAPQERPATEAGPRAKRKRNKKEDDPHYVAPVPGQVIPFMIGDQEVQLRENAKGSRRLYLVGDDGKLHLTSMAKVEAMGETAPDHNLGAHPLTAEDLAPAPAPENSPFKDPDAVKAMFEYADAIGRTTPEQRRTMSIDELAQVLLDVQPAWSAQQTELQELRPAYEYAIEQGLTTSDQWATLTLEQQAAVLDQAATAMQRDGNETDHREHRHIYWPCRVQSRL